MSFNPYAPPKALVEDIDPETSAAEATRRAHIAHERQLKSVGLLFYLSTAMLGVSALAPVIVGGSRAEWPVVALLAALALAAAATGYGFRALRPWVRYPGAAFAAIGLLAVPVGTLINGYILYLMFGARGRVVLAPEHAAIVAATPTVRYRRTIGDWIALGLLVALLVGMALLLVFAPK